MCVFMYRGGVYDCLLVRSITRGPSIKTINTMLTESRQKSRVSTKIILAHVSSVGSVDVLGVVVVEFYSGTMVVAYCIVFYGEGNSSVGRHPCCAKKSVALLWVFGATAR